jgi:hypothetical protein
MAPTPAPSVRRSSPERRPPAAAGPPQRANPVAPADPQRRLGNRGVSAVLRQGPPGSGKSATVTVFRVPARCTECAHKHTWCSVTWYRPAGLESSGRVCKTLRGGGERLPDANRALRSCARADLGGVRIHRDPDAAHANDINARASPSARTDYHRRPAVRPGHHTG